NKGCNQYGLNRLGKRVGTQGMFLTGDKSQAPLTQTGHTPIRYGQFVINDWNELVILCHKKTVSSNMLKVRIPIAGEEVDLNTPKTKVRQH
ncbi:MAG: hypothetical protein PHF92_10895, partial [Bacteroidales bacterium]|nr:hypothetical protein [Bacteroidales bacterium]